MHGVPGTVRRDFLTQTTLSRDLPGRLPGLMMADLGEPAGSSVGCTSDLYADGQVPPSTCEAMFWDLLEPTRKEKHF